MQFDTCDLAGATLTKPQLRRVALLGCRLLGAALLDAQLLGLVVAAEDTELQQG